MSNFDSISEIFEKHFPSENDTPKAAELLGKMMADIDRYVVVVEGEARSEGVESVSRDDGDYTKTGEGSLHCLADDLGDLHALLKEGKTDEALLQIEYLSKDVGVYL